MFEITDNDGSVAWVLEKLSAKKKAKGPEAPKIPNMSVPTPKPLVDDKKKDLKKTQSKEVELWKAWKDSGEQPKMLTPLLKSLAPILNRSAMHAGRGRVEIPPAAIDFEIKKNAIKALKTYDASKGAALQSWLTTNLSKTSRFIRTNQNPARITEPVAKKIGTFKAVRADLTNKLGHEPDDHSLHEALVQAGHDFSMKDIKRLNKEMIKSLVSSQGGLDDFQAAHSSSATKEIIHLIIPDLTPSELAVHEYVHGLNGKPMLKSGEIAKRLKMDASKVSKMKTSTLEKMKKYL